MVSANIAYENSLKKYHGWIVSGIFKVSDIKCSKNHYVGNNHKLSCVLKQETTMFLTAKTAYILCGILFRWLYELCLIGRTSLQL